MTIASTTGVPQTFDLLREILSLAQTLRRSWDRQLRKGLPNMSAPRAAVILQLGKSGGASQMRLARQLNLSQMTVSRLLDDLERLGWVRREPVPGDRRSWAVRLTKDGHEILIAIHAARRDFVARSCAAVDANRCAALAGTLARLEAALR